MPLLIKSFLVSSKQIEQTWKLQPGTKKCGNAIGLVIKPSLRKGMYKTVIINKKSYKIAPLPIGLTIYY